MKISLFLTFLIAPLIGWSQPITPIRWQQCYGGNSEDWGLSILPTPDGGSIIAGATYSTNWDSSRGASDMLILKLDSQGTVEWKQLLGGPGHEFAFDIILTDDDNYIAVGSASSTSGDVTGNHGKEDVWVVKLTSSGKLIWKKCFGGSGYDIGYSIAKDSKDNVAIVGITESNDGDVSGTHGLPGNSDVWVLKLDLNGNLLWQKCYGGSNADAWSVNDGLRAASSIVTTDDDGFVFASTTASNDGDLIERTKKDSYYNDIWVVQIDPEGTIQWQQFMGGESHDEPNCIIRTSDLGYIIVGLWTQTFPGGHHYDAYMGKLRKDGFLEWQRLYGTDTTVECYTAVTETDDGFLFGGVQSNDLSARFINHSDIWLHLTDRNGSMINKKTLGGAGRDYIYDIVRKDNSFELVASSNSIDGTLQSVRTDATQNDIWVVNLGLTSRVRPEEKKSFALYPNPAKLTVNVDFGLDSPYSIRYELRTLVGDLLEETTEHLAPSGRQTHLLNLSTYPSGCYLYTIYINGVPHTETIQLVK